MLIKIFNVNCDQWEEHVRNELDRSCLRGSPETGRSDAC